MNAATKQTARNNSFLASVKQKMNGKIFKRTAEILNASGMFAAAMYVAQYFRAEVRVSILAEMGATIPAPPESPTASWHYFNASNEPICGFVGTWEEARHAANRHNGTAQDAATRIEFMGNASVARECTRFSAVYG